MASSAAVSFVNNGGNLGKTLKDLGSKDSVKSIALAMVSAGVLSELNASLGLERSDSIELGLETRHGPHPMKFSVYDSRYANFIGLLSTGQSQTYGSDVLPEYVYTGVRARLRGWEARVHRI